MTLTNEFPIIERPPARQRSPLVVSVPHSGIAVPDEERDAYAVDIGALVHEGDMYVDLLYQDAVKMGATVVRTPFSRFLVDLNRLADDLSPLSVEGASIRREAGYYGHRGVIWAVTTEGRPIYRSPLSRVAAQRRLERYYHPYHDALREELETLRDHFGFAILLDAHSMPSANFGLKLSDGRADIVPGDLLGKSCAPELREHVIAWWRERGRSAEANRPYRGGAITRTHGAPQRGIHALQLEINRGIYMDERNGRFLTTFREVRRDCRAFVQMLAELDLAVPNAAE